MCIRDRVNSTFTTDSISGSYVTERRRIGKTHYTNYTLAEIRRTTHELYYNIYLVPQWDRLKCKYYRGTSLLSNAYKKTAKINFVELNTIKDLKRI